MRPRPSNFSSSSIRAGVGRTFHSGPKEKVPRRPCAKNCTATWQPPPRYCASSRLQVVERQRIRTCTLSTMRRASFSRSRSSSLTLLARSTQVFANSSKRSFPSMSSSASFTRISRYCWNVSSKNVTEMRPESSSSTTSVRGPRLRSSSTTPGDRHRLAAEERASAFGARRGFLGLDVVDDAAGDEARQIVHEAIDGMTGDRATQRLALGAQAHRVGPLRLIRRAWRAPPPERAQRRGRRCRAARSRWPCCSARPARARHRADASAWRDSPRARRDCRT